jgi:outer membrane protein assembly factor BamB
MQRMARPALLFALPALFAADWPQWRGPGRDGALPSFQEPKAWPERLTRKWKTNVGLGHSSPIFASGRIYVISRQQDREVVSSVNPEDGKILWSQSYAAPYKMNSAAVKHGQGPKSTPVFAGGKLYTLGISGILSCFDAATGQMRWRKDFSRQFAHTSPLFGTAMSPVVDRGLLIAHVGGNDDGALTAFDAESGEVKWSWKGDGPGYASPLVVDLGGTRQVVTQSQKNIVGVDANSGALLWKIPFTTPYVQNIVTPIAYRDTLIFSGLSKGVMAVTVSKSGAQWSTRELWNNQDVSMYMNSPVLMGDLLFGFSHKNKGQFFCLDAQSGKTRWIGEPRQGDNAAIVVAGERLFLLKDDAELTVARAGPKGFEGMRKYMVAESPTWAHPLILENGVVIKDLDSLAFFSFR